jgi:protein-S-isoprenylcysteine O-methyltransferase
VKEISTVGFLLTVAAVGALQLQHALFAMGPVGLAIQLAGLALVVWARLTFGGRSFHFSAPPTPGVLVTRGPYRFVRNPIYGGALLIVAVGVVTHPSLVNVAIGLLALFGTMMRILCEEQLLAKQYPDYAAYQQTTGRLLPFRAIGSLLSADKTFR